MSTKEEKVLDPIYRPKRAVGLPQKETQLNNVHDLQAAQLDGDFGVEMKGNTTAGKAYAFPSRERGLYHVRTSPAKETDNKGEPVKPHVLKLQPADYEIMTRKVGNNLSRAEGYVKGKGEWTILHDPTKIKE